MVSEREQQTLKRLFLTPLSGGVLLFGNLSGLHGHWPGAGGPGVRHCPLPRGPVLAVPWGLHLLIILLSIAAYVGGGGWAFVLGTQFARRTEDVNALIAAFGVPLMILGGTFLPASLFPETLLDIRSVQSDSIT